MTAFVSTVTTALRRAFPDRGLPTLNIGSTQIIRGQIDEQDVVFFVKREAASFKITATTKALDLDGLPVAIKDRSTEDIIAEGSLNRVQGKEGVYSSDLPIAPNTRINSANLEFVYGYEIRPGVAEPLTYSVYDGEGGATDGPVGAAIRTNTGVEVF